MDYVMGLALENRGFPLRRNRPPRCEAARRHQTKSMLSVGKKLMRLEKRNFVRETLWIKLAMIF